MMADYKGAARSSKHGKAAFQRTRSRANQSCLLQVVVAGAIIAAIGLGARPALGLLGVASPVINLPASSNQGGKLVMVITPVPYDLTELADNVTPSPTPTVPVATPTVTQEPSATPAASTTSEMPFGEGITPSVQVTSGGNGPVLYYTQSGDTLSGVAVRFDVKPADITSPEPIPDKSWLNPGQLLVIPTQLKDTSPDTRLLPDSEVVFSPSAVDFDVQAFVDGAGGYLSTYEEYLGNTGWSSGADVVERVAIETSTNPRLLLSIIEYLSHWVYGKPEDVEQTDYPLIKDDTRAKGLYLQLATISHQIAFGYYGWRESRLVELEFKDGVKFRPAPVLNAGSVGLQYAFTQHFKQEEWERAMYSAEGLPTVHKQMFGDSWVRAQNFEPLFPPTLTQPNLILPFELDRIWSYTSGPHPAWKDDGSFAALDFAPASAYHGCAESKAWVVAPAAGFTVRSGYGILTLDLDGDGSEQTGWVIFFLHIKTEDRIPPGTLVNTGDRLGHPSCEGGSASGTHVHIARKYNGEWIPADGAMPFTMSGWVTHLGEEAYKGTLTRGDQTVTSSFAAIASTNIKRIPDDPYEQGQ